MSEVNTCINIRHPEVIELSTELGLPTIVVGAKIQVWQSKTNDYSRFPTKEELVDGVNFSITALIKISSSLSKVENWWKVIKNKEEFWNKVQKDLQIPKEQIELLKQTEGSSIEEILMNFAANYSYAVEIHTAKTKEKNIKESRDGVNFNIDGDIYRSEFTGEVDFDEFGGSPVIKYTKNGEVITEEEFLKQRDKATNKLSQYYSNLTVPGGTNYTENEIATPAITPSIKGHAQFSTDNGIGWFRSDDKSIGETSSVKEQVVMHEGVPVWTGKMVDISKGGTSTTTRRILELQSDLFQKGRDRQDLAKGELNDKVIKITEPYLGEGKVVSVDSNGNLDVEYDSGGADFGVKPDKFRKVTNIESKNQFLQLLNKDNNWVRFFIQSIIQDSIKKGYEKVLFPTGNTASKVEGHTTLEEFKKQKEDRVRVLEEDTQKNKQALENGYYLEEYKGLRPAEKEYLTDVTRKQTEETISRNTNELIQLKQELERVETEGFAALKPIFAFYENQVRRILEKTDNPKPITDEYGNTWIEVDLMDRKTQSNVSNIFLSINPLLAQFKSEIKLKKKEISSLQKALVNKRVAQANAKLGTSFYISYKQIGQSDNWTWEIVNKSGGQTRMFAEQSYEIDKNLRDKYFYDGSRQTSRTILQRISESSHPLNKLAEHLLKYTTEISNVPIELVKTNALRGVAAGSYYPSVNYIEIAEYALFSPKGAESTILHEIIHALTNRGLNQGATGSIELHNAYIQAKNQLEDSYPLSNLDEFTVALFTNPTFIKELMTLPATGNKWANLFEEIFDYILALFKISKKDTLYDEAFAAATQVINSVKEELQSIEQSVDNNFSLFPSNTPTNETLNKILLDFLTQFGIKSEEVELIADERGYTPLALADFTNRIIKWSKGHTAEIPEEAAHFVLGLMERNTTYSNLLKLARKSKKYQQVREQYSDVYGNDEAKLIFETAGKLLADAFNGVNEENEEHFLTRTLKRVINWVRSLFGKMPLSDLKTKITQAFGDIAQDILDGKVTSLDVKNLGKGVYYSVEDKVEEQIANEQRRIEKLKTQKTANPAQARAIDIRIKKSKASVSALEKENSIQAIINVALKNTKETNKILSKDNLNLKDFIDTKVLLPTLSALDDFLEGEVSPEQKKQVEYVRDESLRLTRLWRDKQMEVVQQLAREEGYVFDEAAFTEAIKDISSAKRKFLSADTSHIPVMKVIHSKLIEMQRDVSAEFKEYEKASREIRDTFKKQDFLDLLDNNGKLITHTKSEFFAEEIVKLQALTELLSKTKDKGERKKAYEEVNNWYRDNVEYALTEDNEKLYQDSVIELLKEVIEEDSVIKDKLDSVDKTRFDLHIIELMNEDDTLSEYDKAQVLSEIQTYSPYRGMEFVKTGKMRNKNYKWYRYLTQSPKQKWVNPKYEEVKNLPLYKFIVDTIVIASSKIPHRLLVDLGSYDKLLYKLSFDLNKDKLSFGAAWAGIKDFLTDTLMVKLSQETIEGKTRELVDEKGNIMPVIRYTKLEDLSFSDPIALLDAFYKMALTYEHAVKTEPEVELLYDLLINQDAIKTNIAGSMVIKDDVPVIVSNGLKNAQAQMLYDIKAKLYGRTRLDEDEVTITDKQRREFAKALDKWKVDSELAKAQGLPIPEKPTLNKFSFIIKTSDALVDYTRILALGLKPSSAIMNLIIGINSNYLYAARKKDVTDAQLTTALKKIMKSVGRYWSGNRMPSPEGKKIANIAYNFGITDNTIEDQEKYTSRFTKFLFTLQTGGEFIIAGQLLIAKMLNTQVTNLKGEVKTLYDAYDEEGEWNTKEFGAQPEWTSRKTLEDGLNTSKLKKFMDEFTEMRKRTQGDYIDAMEIKGEWYGRVLMLFRTWLPRVVYERFGGENGDFKGRYLTYRDVFNTYTEKDGWKGGVRLMFQTVLTVAAKLPALPLIKRLGFKTLSDFASERNEKILREMGISELDIENMRVNIRELQFIVYAIALMYALRGLGGGEDDKELNYLANLVQRYHQDLTFFYSFESVFSIIRDPIPVWNTISNIYDVVPAAITFVTNNEADTYQKGFRKGDSKLVKEASELIPVASAYQSTMSMMAQIFGENSYKF